MVCKLLYFNEINYFRCYYMKHVFLSVCQHMLVNVQKYCIDCMLIVPSVRYMVFLYTFNPESM